MENMAEDTKAAATMLADLEAALEDVSAIFAQDLVFS